MSLNRFDPSYFFLCLFSILVILFGFYLGGRPFRMMVYLQSIQEWPQVDGQVISSQVEEPYQAVKVPGGRRYIPRVWFAYTIDGRKNVSRSLFLREKYYSSAAAAQSVVGRYPVGSKVAVKYSSQDPSVVFIEQSVFSVADILQAGGAFFLVLCGFLSCVDLFTRKRKK